MGLLKMYGITKSFNGVTVLHHVDLTVGKGEVHALLGENGAGKSTLMNVLTGVFPRDGGTVEFDGKEIGAVTIRQSEELGIAFVHQELNLFNDLKVYENIFLGREYKNRIGKLDKKKMVAETRELFEELGVLGIDPAQYNAAYLDNLAPTTSLNNDEVAHLFSIVNSLKRENGTSFIFISHKMPEIFEISDRYTVFRNGHFIGTGNISDTDPESVTRLMVGEGYSAEDVYRQRETGGEALKLEHFSGPGFSDVSLTVKKGQVIGLTGLQGAGSSELMQCMFGSTAPTGGKMLVHGKPLPTHSIHSAMKAGIAMLAANRKENSVLPDMSLLENMYLSEHTLSAWKPLIRKRGEKEKFETYRGLLNIKAQGSDSSILSLSGGNQQKVFIARWLNTDAEVLLFDNPTQGIDVGAKAEIYKLILELAKSGKTILINTLEIPEIQKVADFCVVFYNGGIIKVLGHDEIDETTVMLYSTNAINSEEVQ